MCRLRLQSLFKEVESNKEKRLEKNKREEESCAGSELSRPAKKWRHSKNCYNLPFPPTPLLDFGTHPTFVISSSSQKLATLSPFECPFIKQTNSSETNLVYFFSPQLFISYDQSKGRRISSVT